MDTRKATINGTIWSMIERFSTMGIQLLCTLIIAQYLPPSQFGLVSMMSIFLSFSMVMAEAGFGQAIIREKDVQQLDTSSIFYFNIIIAIIIYCLSFLCAPFIASFYRQPELTALMRVAFLAIIIQSFAIVQGSLLQKSVNFSVVSKASLIAVFLSGIIGIVIAIIYKNAWALVFQSLSFSTFQTAFFWLFCNWRPSLLYSWKAVKKYLGFSLSLLGSRLIASIADNLANMFIGRAYTSTELGYYTVPDKLQRSIAGSVSFSIHRVSYPVMSTFQDDVEKLRVYSQGIVGVAFYIISPIMIYLLVVSPQFFSVILSPEWAESAIYFRYMCVIGAVFCFADINMDILLVKGRSKMVLYLEIVRKTVLVACLLIGILYSIKTLLVILVLYNVFNAILISYFSGKEIKCSLFQQLLNILPTALCLLMSGFVTYFISGYFSNAYFCLVITFFVFFFLYLLSSHLLRIKHFYVLFNVVKGLKLKK